MKVWVVLHSYYEETWPWSVWDSQQAADHEATRLNELVKKRRRQSEFGVFQVVDMELNAPHEYGREKLTT